MAYGKGYTDKKKMKKPSKKVMTKRTNSTNPMGKANKHKKVKKGY